MGSRKEWFCFGGGLFFPRGTGFSFTSLKNNNKKKSTLEDWLCNLHNSVDALSHAELLNYVLSNGMVNLHGVYFPH